MKKFVLLSAVVAGLAFAASEASAQLKLNVSGTIKCQEATGYKIGTVKSVSFNEKTLYLLMTNWVLRASQFSGGEITNGILPADGYIVFDPNRPDGKYTGSFYVTNSSGYFFALSGMDSVSNYYSWIELDTEIPGVNSSYEFGPSYEPPYDLFNNMVSYNVSSNSVTSKDGNGSASLISTGVIFIHEDPYAYDDADNAYVIKSNFNPWIGAPQGHGYDNIGRNLSYLEIRGLVTGSLNMKDFAPTVRSLSINGTGNFYQVDITFNPGVFIGQASFSP